MPHVAASVLLGFISAFGAAVLAGSLVLGYLHPLFFVLVPEGLLLTLIYPLAVITAWTLTLDPAGMTSRRGSARRSQVAVRWEQISRIGVQGRGMLTYLCVWGMGVSADPSMPLRVCPVGGSRFRRRDLRAAIRYYCPNIDIDPGM